MGFKVVLTADKTLMSNYGGGLFYGFISTAPRRGAWYLNPEWLFRFVFTEPPCGEGGKALVAPHGLRRIEAALIDSGVVSEEEVIVAAPHSLDIVIDGETQVIGVSAIDPLGMGPASTTIAGPYGWVHEEPFNAWHFRKLVKKRTIQEARRKGAFLVVGGPGAWQLSEEKMREYGIDVVVVGEAELAFPKLVLEIMRGEVEPPRIVEIPLSEYPSADQIPLLRGATVGGLVEVSRGCGRGCRFCTPTMRKLRHRKLEDIVHDVMVNLKHGQRSICLHAEDVLRYGSYALRVEHEKVVRLFKAVKGVGGIDGFSISHAALSSIAASPQTVREISEIMELDYHHWMGFQTGIETGSPRLIEALMNMKPYPFTPGQWPEVVEEAFGICMDNGWVPCASLIVNLPGETEDDIIKTTELVENLRPYRSFIAPLLYVPMNSTPDAKPMRFLEDAQWYHLELYRAIWRHNIKWLEELAWSYSRGSGPLAKMAIRLVVKVIKGVLNSKVEEFLDREISKRRARITAL